MPDMTRQLLQDRQTQPDWLYRTQSHEWKDQNALQTLADYQPLDDDEDEEKDDDCCYIEMNVFIL